MHRSNGTRSHHKAQQPNEQRGPTKEPQKGEGEGKGKGKRVPTSVDAPHSHPGAEGNQTGTHVVDPCHYID
jgi:hypothetical protein